jgi:hypothetical protein
MCFLKGGIKRNPERRWALPDRIFFGFGACHILAEATSALDIAELNARKMLGPDQCLHDALPRAEAFIARIDHEVASARARQLAD